MRPPRLEALDSEIAALEEFTDFGLDFRRDLIASLQEMGRHNEISKSLVKSKKAQ